MSVIERNSIRGGFILVRYFSFILILNLLIFTSAGAKDSYVVGTYNIKGQENETALRTDFSNLQQVDIWALQEVNVAEKEDAKQKIFKILPQGVWHIVYVPVNLVDAKKRIWEGQAIASKLPILSKHIIELDHSGKKRRIALSAQIENVPFIFINTDHEVELFKLGFNDRKKQILSLLKFTSQTSENFVIVGDFNASGNPWSWNNEEELEQTKNIFSQNYFQMVPSASQYAFTFDSGPVRNQIDLFFTRGLSSSKWHRLETRIGSDHYPIYAEFFKN